MNEISVTELADDAVLLDVREPDEFAAGHAENAVHVPLGMVPARVADLPSVDGPLPVICRSGGRSAHAAMWLESNGIAAVTVAGGMQDWQAKGKAMVSDGDTPTVL